MPLSDKSVADEVSITIKYKKATCHNIIGVGQDKTRRKSRPESPRF
jgi:hypothetical protein